MVKCFYCDEEIDMLPFNCNYCKNYYCKDHRLPEKHECTFQFPKKMTAIRKNINRPLTYAANKYYARTSAGNKAGSQLTGAQILLISSFVMFFIALFMGNRYEFIFLSVYNYIPPSYWYHTIFTSMLIPPFSSSGIFLFLNMIFYAILIYFLGRNIEGRFGRRIFLKIYFTGALITSGSVIALQLLMSSIEPIYRLLLYSSSQGGIIALVAFVARNDPEREMTFILYLMPIKIRMKHLLWIFIGLQALNLILSFDFIQPVANIMGLFGGVIVLESLKGQRQGYGPY